MVATAPPCRFRRSRHADGASATACRPVAAPTCSSLREYAFWQFGMNGKSDGRATSGRSAQRSRVRASTGFDAVSLRASPSHLPGLGPPHRPRYGHMPCYAKGPLPSGKGPDLHKLVAGEGLNPRPLGYEPYDARLCRLGRLQSRRWPRQASRTSPSRIFCVSSVSARPAASRAQFRAQIRFQPQAFIPAPLTASLQRPTAPSRGECHPRRAGPAGRCDRISNCVTGSPRE